MKRLLDLSFIVVLMFTCIFLITGCGEKKSLFDLEQVNDKTIKINIENGKVGEEKTGKLIVDTGDKIKVISKMEGTAGVNLYYFKKGVKHDKKNADYELINGEGESTTEDFPAGEYEVVFEVMDKGATGTIEINIK